jgi:transposase InsO family protein
MSRSAAKPSRRPSNRWRSFAPHVTQNIRVSTLFYEPAQGHHIVGHHWSFGLEFDFAIRLYRKIYDDHPESCSLATAPLRGALRERLGYQPVTPPNGTRPGRISAASRNRQPDAKKANALWLIDFGSEALFDSRKLWDLKALDAFTREALAIDVESGIKGEQVVKTMTRKTTNSGAPKTIWADNGP